MTEAGLIFPANPEFSEKADESKLSSQTVKYMEAMSKSRSDAKVRVQYVYDNVEYENGSGEIFIRDTLLDLCKGNITIEEAKKAIEDAFTAAVRKAVENGEVDPEEYK